MSILENSPHLPTRATHSIPRLLEVRAYPGPNPYGYRPAIRVKFDLGPLEEYPTTRIGGFTDRLLDALPTLHEHGSGVYNVVYSFVEERIGPLAAHRAHLPYRHRDRQR